MHLTSGSLVGLAVRERAKLGKDLDEQLFATLYVQFSVDPPQVGMHGMGRQTEMLSDTLLGRSVEHGTHHRTLSR